MSKATDVFVAMLDIQCRYKPGSRLQHGVAGYWYWKDEDTTTRSAYCEYCARSISHVDIARGLQCERIDDE